MRATDLALATLKAWESNDAHSLASYLSDEGVCRGFFPQPVDKAQYLDFMRAIMQAFPDWSFHGQVLYEQPFAEHGQSVLVVTQITGTQTGELILPPLPIISATGTRITFPNRHLEYRVIGETIATISADFSPNGLEELLAYLGMVLP